METIPAPDSGGRHALNGDPLPPLRIPIDEDLVKQAADALRHFLLPDRFQAAKLLTRWPRYYEMTNDEKSAVLSHYPSRGDV